MRLRSMQGIKTKLWRDESQLPFRWIVLMWSHGVMLCREVKRSQAGSKEVPPFCIISPNQRRFKIIGIHNARRIAIRVNYAPRRLHWRGDRKWPRKNCSEWHSVNGKIPRHWDTNTLLLSTIGGKNTCVFWMLLGWNGFGRIFVELSFITFNPVNSMCRWLILFS